MSPTDPTDAPNVPDDVNPTDGDIPVEPEGEPASADADIHRRTMAEPKPEGPSMGDAFRSGS